MDETGKQLLHLMFKAGETVCVSNSKYGYHSIPLESAFQDEITLVHPDETKPLELAAGDKINLVALNPIKGFRRDENCTAFRSFLVEMDTGPLDQQLAYIKALGMPYSAVIFSGNKSLHFLITLDTDLPSEKVYRMFSEWILNICTLADQMTKNPSRSIRIPGAIRDGDRRQRLVEIRSKVRLMDLVVWLSKKPEAKPKTYEKRAPSDKIDAYKVRKWVRDRLRNGLDPTKGRNQQWYAIAYEFALSGYTEDGTMALLEEFFTPERDFREREWRMCIKSAFKHVYAGK